MNVCVNTWNTSWLQTITTGLPRPAARTASIKSTASTKASSSHVLVTARMCMYMYVHFNNDVASSYVLVFVYIFIHEVEVCIIAY